eukprot:3914577-Amphidinium_carterae.1
MEQPFRATRPMEIRDVIQMAVRRHDAWQEVMLALIDAYLLSPPMLDILVESLAGVWAQETADALVEARGVFQQVVAMRSEAWRISEE